MSENSYTDLTTLNSPNQVSNKRRLSQTSPIIHNSIIKKQTTDFKMGELSTLEQKMDKLLENFEGIRSEISSIAKTVSSLDKKIIEMNSEIDQVKRDVSKIKIDATNYDEKLILQYTTTSKLAIESNKQEQRALGNQISIINISNKLDNKDIITQFNEWCGKLADNHLVKRINIVENKKEKSKIIFLHFWNERTKAQLINTFKSKQWNENNTFTPILNEHIFNLDASDTKRGTEINYRHQMTKTNKEIFNILRKEKKINENITGVWLAEDAIRLKLKDNQKSFPVLSVAHANDIAMNSQSMMDEN